MRANGTVCANNSADHLERILDRRDGCDLERWREERSAPNNTTLNATYTPTAAQTRLQVP
jgi:hypothetical protein